MDCTGSLKEIKQDWSTGKIEVVFTINEKEALPHIAELQNVEKLSITAKKYRPKRSLDSNGYLWILCDKIAYKLKSTKEEVYRKAINEVGVFDSMLVTEEAVDDFITRWNSSGLGNYAEVTHDSKKNPGCKIVRVYFGSSTYNTVEMARLIDYIVDEAKGLGIETLTPSELERLKATWQSQ